MVGSGLRGRGGLLAARAAMTIVLALAALGALIRLGYGPLVAFGLLVCLAIGGAFEVPLTRGRSGGGSMRLGLNVGGALIPLAIAAQQATRLPGASRPAAVGAVALVALASFVMARVVPSRGVLLPWALPGMLAAALGLVLAPAAAPALAYLAAVVGSFVGADLFTIAAVARLGSARAVLGGGGPADGLVWTGLLAAWLAGS